MFGHVIHELFTYGCEPFTDQYSVNTDDIISGVIVIISFAVDKVFGLVKDHNFEKVTDLGSVLGGHYKLINHIICYIIDEDSFLSYRLTDGPR